MIRHIAAIDRETGTDLVTLTRDAAARHRQIADYHVIVVDARVETLPGQWDAARLERRWRLLPDSSNTAPANTQHVTASSRARAR